MNIGIMGTGIVGKTLGAKLAEVGHAVMIGTRDPVQTLARTEPDMPPSLFVSNTDSLTEHIQRASPEVKVVKTLNTMNAYVMANPRQLADGDHHAFVGGNDAQAKAQVIDLGDITTARGTEMYLPIWLRLWGALGTGIFNVKIVK